MGIVFEYLSRGHDDKLTADRNQIVYALAGMEDLFQSNLDAM